MGSRGQHKGADEEFGPGSLGSWALRPCGGLAHLPWFRARLGYTHMHAHAHTHTQVYDTPNCFFRQLAIKIKKDVSMKVVRKCLSHGTIIGHSRN